MNDKKSDDISPSIQISGYENSQRLGRIISHEGAIQLLFALHDKPKLFKELRKELGLPDSTFEILLKDLREQLKIIRKTETVADNRDTHHYIIEPIGRELIRLIKDYERYMALSVTKQKVLEIEKNNTESH